MSGELYPGEFEAMEHNGRMDALEQESCENWCDVPSDEMTLEQARQAVKDLRKKLAEYLEQEPCEDAISREDALMALTGEWTEITDEIIHRFIKRIKALPPVNPQPEWIDVGKRLPEKYGEYLITWTTSQSKRPFIGISEGEVTGEYDHEHNRFKFEWLLEDYIKAYPNVEVIAWMPLPNPYEP